jgi:abortive infection bacteriophage resistance protein
MNFNKPTLSISQQISQLRGRGLAIGNEADAEHFLKNISYYRLAGYWWPLQSDKVNHIFKPNSRFEAVIDIYNFDRSFRLLLFDAIERVEIGFRTRLIYELSLDHSAWWFEDGTLFKDSHLFRENLQLIDRELTHSREVFIKEHYAKYTAPNRPPAWKTIEILSLGHLSKLYSNLNTSPAKKRVAQSLDLPKPLFLESWLQAISLLRNLCAHHSRVWNKNLPKPPQLVPHLPKPWLNTLPSGPNKVYAPLCCIKYLLNTVSPDNSLTTQLVSLFDQYPAIDGKALGFEDSWSAEALWQ